MLANSAAAAAQSAVVVAIEGVLLIVGFFVALVLLVWLLEAKTRLIPIGAGTYYSLFPKYGRPPMSLPLARVRDISLGGHASWMAADADLIEALTHLQDRLGLARLKEVISLGKTDVHAMRKAAIAELGKHGHPLLALRLTILRMIGLWEHRWSLHGGHGPARQLDLVITNGGRALEAQIISKLAYLADNQYAGLKEKTYEILRNHGKKPLVSTMELSPEIRQRFMRQKFKFKLFRWLSLLAIFPLGLSIAFWVYVYAGMAYPDQTRRHIFTFMLVASAFVLIAGQASPQWQNRIWSLLYGRPASSVEFYIRHLVNTAGPLRPVMQMKDGQWSQIMVGDPSFPLSKPPPSSAPGPGGTVQELTDREAERHGLTTDELPGVPAAGES